MRAQYCSRLSRQVRTHLTSPASMNHGRDKHSRDSERITMSFANQTQTAESQDSAANNDDDDTFAPEPITGRYLSVQAHLGLLKDAIGAVDSFSMDDSDLPAVKWANAVQDALYTRDGCLGEQQGETPYTTDDFKEVYGDSITTDHAGLLEDERTELLELFQNSENHSGDDLKDEYKLPVINGDRLPLLVADEDVLSEAKEMLDAIVEEGNDAASTTPDVDDNDDSDDDEPPVAVLREDGTLDDLERELNDDECYYTQDELEAMLAFEKANKDRKGGRDLLEAAIEERSTTDDDDDDDDETEADDDTDADSTTDDGGLTDEQIEKVASATATAVASTLSEMDF